jgi:hypothetical protein
LWAASINRICTDAALSKDLVRRGYENVKRFSWEKCGIETLDVLQSVVVGQGTALSRSLLD